MYIFSTTWAFTKTGAYFTIDDDMSFSATFYTMDINSFLIDSVNLRIWFSLMQMHFHLRLGLKSCMLLKEYDHKCYLLFQKKGVEETNILQHIL